VVLELVRGLPDRQRACLVLRYYMELSESETAETLGISKSSVKTHCRRGLAALESTLGEPS
jgi:RNA polymerase sigma factor (sigma-70 family)